jgi:hypothetical protein
MKNSIISVLLIFVSIVFLANVTPVKGFNTRHKLNSPDNKIKKVRTVLYFNVVKVKAGMNVYLIQGETPKVEIEADENVIDLITTEVKDSILTIFPNKTTNSLKSIKIFVTFKDLKSISASSGSSVQFETKFNAPDLILNISNGSSFKGLFSVKKLICTLNSGSEIKITGEADYSDIRVSSGSNFKGGGLIIKNCKIVVSSGSNVHVNVIDDFTANVTSGSRVSCTGNPKKKNLNSSVGSEIIMEEKNSE